MRLYTLTGASEINDPEFGTFTVGEDGAFDGLPEELANRLHPFPAWEDDAERTLRLVVAEQKRLADPATMLAEMQAMAQGQRELAAALMAARAAAAPAVEAAPAEVPAASAPKRRGRPAASASSAETSTAV